MSDSTEVAAWNEAVRSWINPDTNTAVQDGALLLHAGLRLVTALRRTEVERDAALTRIQLFTDPRRHRAEVNKVATEYQRDEAHRLLEAALLDLVVEEDDDGAYMPGELPDQIRAFLAGTTSKEPKL